MKNIVIGLLVLGFSLGLGGCVFPPAPDGTLEIAGNKFRKTGSINTEMLRAGVKRTRGVNRFDPMFLPVIDGKVVAKQVTDVFNEQTGKVAFKAAVKAKLDVADVNAGGNVTSESTVTGSYSVFTLFDVYDYVGVLNSPKNRNDLEKLMKELEPRVITSVAIVFNRESSRKISASGNVILEIINSDIGNPEVTVVSEASGEAVAKLSDGTVFAYEFARICWEKSGETIRVATIAVDRPGWDDECPSGTEDRVSKL
jgi:hypothetical protein